MRDDRLTFFKNLVEAPSPSGFEGPARAIWRGAVESSAATVHADRNGNTIAVHQPGGAPRVMLAGHIDEIGFMVTYIDDDGFLSIAAIGGQDAAVAVGQRVQVHTSDGPLRGVVGRQPIHLMQGDEKGKGVKLTDLWIDLGVKDGATVAQRVRVGDPVTVDVGLEHLDDGRAVSRALDNKMGAFIVAETFKEAVARGAVANLVAVATVQEEVGLRGAFTSVYSVDPAIGIAVDVTHALDHPGAGSAKKRLGDIRLGKGPVIGRGPTANPTVVERLIAAAEEAGIPYQLEAMPGSSGTDADALQRGRGGVAAAVVSVALRYMHTPVEVIDLDDVEQTIALLTEFVCRLDGDVDLIPR